MGSFRPRRDDRPPIPGPPPVVRPPEEASPQEAPPRATSEDEEAIARYRYMLQTAPPEAIEQAHAEAFERLTPEQRRLVLDQLANHVDPHERPRSDDPRELARVATRAEIQRPGFMEGTFGGLGIGGGGFGGSLLSSLAGAFVGTAIFNQLFGGGLMGGGLFGSPFGWGGFGYPMGAFPMTGDTFDGYPYMDEPAIMPDPDFGPTADDYNQDPLGDPGDLTS